MKYRCAEEKIELLLAPGRKERGAEAAAEEFPPALGDRGLSGQADKGVEESISGLETNEGFSPVAGTTCKEGKRRNQEKRGDPSPSSADSGDQLWLRYLSW